MSAAVTGTAAWESNGGQTPRPDYDVIVVGLGFAGAMTAIAAHDRGARVAIFEKSEHPGGISILAGGGLTCGTDHASTLAYLVRTSGDNTPRDVLAAFAQGMLEIPERIGALATEVGFETKRIRTGGSYPFEGADQIFSIYIPRNERYGGFPWVRGERAGATLFWVLFEQLKRRPKIDIFYTSPVRELITSEDGAVTGVVVERDGRRSTVQASGGVVLCSGGFEHNAELVRQSLPMTGVKAIGPLTHTGDGVFMAQKVGAALWHMWHVHGSYGFHVPGVPVGLRIAFDGYRDDSLGGSPKRKMPWIVVDQSGRRFMNEFPPAPQDTPIRALDHYDADLQAFTRIPSYAIFDDDGRALGPIAKAIVSSEAIEFAWSQDNLGEVESGLIKKANSLPELAQTVGLDTEAFAETIERWNSFCVTGVDRDFHRPAGTMLPLVKPPFYGVPVWPIISNTQGGPVHDARQRVLDAFGKPIPHLYAAGELGSIFGHLYLLGGNLSECFIGGRIAGEAAADEAVADPRLMQETQRV